VTERDHTVEVSGGKGVVVGDYATVFQSFADRSRPVATYLRTAQFQALVKERTRAFVGRQFVFDGVDRLLSGAEFASGYVVIRGEPGIGKTAIAASMVLRRGCVHHFNIAPENIRSARQFLEGVCAQLILRYELDHASLPPEAGSDAGFLSQLLGEAADVARERDLLPVVVVVDALDEAEDTGVPAAANRLFLPRVLPDGVFFVVTTREEMDYRLDVDNAGDLWIRDDDPANERDVLQYVERFVDVHSERMLARLAEWGLDREEFVAEVTALSEGNFMYLVHVLPEIAAGRIGDRSSGSAIELPRGLRGYYLRHWRDMKDDDPQRFELVQRPVLCFLAIGREPVTVRQLAEWTGLSPGDVRAVIEEWREFLNEDRTAQSPLYRIYHRSFADFLDEHEDLRWYHDSLALHALAKVPGFLS
jgi:hypothetical protein